MLTECKCWNHSNRCIQNWESLQDLFTLTSWHLFLQSLHFFIKEVMEMGMPCSLFHISFGPLIDPGPHPLPTWWWRPLFLSSGMFSRCIACQAYSAVVLLWGFKTIPKVSLFQAPPGLHINQVSGSKLLNLLINLTSFCLTPLYSVMMTLMSEEIEDIVEKGRPRQLFRRWVNFK